MNVQTEAKLDKNWLEIYHARGLYQGIDFKHYQILKAKERQIAASQNIETVSLDEVMADFTRNGSVDSQFLPKGFVGATMEDSRKAYVFGYKGLITYFATGTTRENPKNELGLISAHLPGGPGGGGWGLNGTRKLQLTKKPLLGWKKEFDPDEWVAHSTAWVYEGYNGKLQHASKKDQEVVHELWREIRKCLAGE